MPDAIREAALGVGSEVLELADPQFVDERIKVAGYDDLLTEATAKLIGDPGTAKQFQRFLKEGDWTTDETTASVRHKDASEYPGVECSAACSWCFRVSSGFVTGWKLRRWPSG